jgi:glyoxylase-like metal-dependent hydrolase (beta-lactamase superfamily II)/rhodanese-related sulfurtransferase
MLGAVEVIPIDTPSLGDRSYIATDGSVAVVIDPQRDIDRVLAITEPRGLRITHVLETHIHNDYVTGGYQLAQQVGALYCVNADDPVSYERHPVRDGDEFAAGAMRIRVVATPGHTFTHLSYALADTAGTPVGVFTGGSLLFGSTGRPDLLGFQHADTLARHQWNSAQRLASELPDEAEVYPTHGFGSFCSATQAEGLSSTIGHEKTLNPVLTRPEDDYVEELLAGLVAYPAYYAHMGPTNARGPGEVDLDPPATADPAELRRRIEAGEWVVDLRTRKAFAAGHVPQSFNFGLDGSFVTYLGWIIPWGTSVTLLGETSHEVAEAQREMVRIGIDRPAAMATGSPQDWAGGGALATYPAVRFADVAAARERGEDPLLIDLRRDDERRAGHIVDTHHLPLHELFTRMDEIPTDRPVWLHCEAGYRASIAASILQAAGRDVVLVDDDFYPSAVTSGLDLTAGEPATR